jgi:hypothetical protein
MQNQNDSHPQLWNAGPVRILARSHKRGRSWAVPKQCAFVDSNGVRCPNAARAKQAAKYCDEHATSRDYILGRIPARVAEETVECIKPTCFRRFTRRSVGSEDGAGQAWEELCPGCRALSPLTLRQLRKHRVSYDLSLRWLLQGDDLACERPGCGRRFRAGGKGPVPPHIDHDHTCCDSGWSCGECIRGVVCRTCNFAVGQLEYLLRSTTFDELRSFLDRSTF